MDLVERLEAEFGIKIPDQDMVPRRFEPLPRSSQHVDQRRGAEMAAILGFGAYLPERVVDHEELARQLGVEADWILQACGIRERRYAAPEETVVDMAEKAARACLERTGLDSVRAGRDPGGHRHTAPPVPRRLRQSPAASRRSRASPWTSTSPAAAASSPSPCAAELCGRLGPILVVASEKMSEVVQRHPAKETTILFGDGAGACVVSPGPGLLEIQDWVASSDGTFADDLCLEPGGPLVMNGRQVIMQANRKLTGAVKSLLERTGTPAQEVGLFLFHQANLNLLKQVAKGLAIPEDRVFVNLETRGNTSAASVLIAASEAQDQGRFRSGETGHHGRLRLRVYLRGAAVPGPLARALDLPAAEGLHQCARHPVRAPAARVREVPRHQPRAHLVPAQGGALAAHGLVGVEERAARLQGQFPLGSHDPGDGGHGHDRAVRVSVPRDPWAP